MTVYITLASICFLFAILALWRFNILLSIVSSASWLAFLFYHLNNVPTNVTKGDTTDTYIVLAIVIMIIAVPVITFARDRKREGMSIGSIEGDEIRRVTNRVKSRLEMTEEEYKADNKRLLRRRR
jgi:uncharacterized membrane protein